MVRSRCSKNPSMDEVTQNAIAAAANFCGVAWLALAMRVHWVQVFVWRPRSPRSRLVLRLLGGVALLTSFFTFVQSSHISMAPLVWLMSLIASAISVAMLLAWRPRMLAPLAPWLIHPKAR
jgi:hypothetical protein